MIACPRCAVPAVACHQACPSCGFSLQALVSAFGADLIQLPRLTDDAHSLRLHEFREIESMIESFERTFPQVFAVLYFGVLPATLSVSELAFLILNRGALAERASSRLNEHALAVVIDPVARNAGIMVGYALEAFLPPRKLGKILRKIRTPLWHAEYVPAVKATLAQVASILRRYARCDRPRHTLPPPTAEDFLASSGFQSLRPPPNPDSRDKHDDIRDDVSGPDHPPT